MQAPIHCTLCPRHCGANRAQAPGYCGGGALPKVARAALHMWEEPCISGAKGSGTVFFSGCALRCCYCQNHTISSGGFGREVTVPQLADLFLRLQAQGAHNINLVTAGHYWPWVREALLLAKPSLRIPVVYNTGGYETPQALAALADCVDIYLTDIKYFSSALSAEYSDAADYFDVASRAAQIMCAQTGAPVLDKDGVLQRGVIVRHLALPGALQDSFAVLDFMATQLPKGGFFASLMSQYTPAYRAAEHGALGRRISTYEYRTLVNRAIDLGLTQGYMQEKSSAKEEYTPPFNLQGLEHLAP